MDNQLVEELMRNLRMIPEEVFRLAGSPIGECPWMDTVRDVVDELGLEEVIRLCGVTAVTASRWYLGIQRPNAANLRRVDELYGKLFGGARDTSQ